MISSTYNVFVQYKMSRGEGAGGADKSGIIFSPPAIYFDLLSLHKL